MIGLAVYSSLPLHFSEGTSCRIFLRTKKLLVARSGWQVNLCHCLVDGDHIQDSLLHDVTFLAACHLKDVTQAGGEGCKKCNETGELETDEQRTPDPNECRNARNRKHIGCGLVGSHEHDSLRVPSARVRTVNKQQSESQCQNSIYSAHWPVQYCNHQCVEG